MILLPYPSLDIIPHVLASVLMMVLSESIDWFDVLMNN